MNDLNDIIIFLTKRNLKSTQALEENILKTHGYFLKRGINVAIVPIHMWDQTINCKISITLGAYKPHSKRGMITGKIIEHQKKQGNRHIVIDSGYIHKRSEYWSVGWDGLNGRADFQNKNSDDSRVKEWGIKLEPWRINKNGAVLFCLQLPWDASVANVDYAKHTKETVNRILESTDRDVIIREHPLRNKGRSPNLPVSLKHKEVVDNLLKLKRVYTSKEKFIEDDFDKSWCVVAYSSNSTVEATMRGIPSFVADKGSMTWHISSQDLDIENPKMPDRKQWFYDISYAQWNHEEITSGIPFKRLGMEKYLF